MNTNYVPRPIEILITDKIGDPVILRDAKTGVLYYPAQIMGAVSGGLAHSQKDLAAAKEKITKIEEASGKQGAQDKEFLDSLHGYVKEAIRVHDLDTDKTKKPTKEWEGVNTRLEAVVDKIVSYNTVRNR